MRLKDLSVIFIIALANADQPKLSSKLVSVQGVKSLEGHFACLCREFDFYEAKKPIIIFQQEKGNTFTL